MFCEIFTMLCAATLCRSGGRGGGGEWGGPARTTLVHPPRLRRLCLIRLPVILFSILSSIILWTHPITQAYSYRSLFVQKMTHPITQACSLRKWPTLLRKPYLLENDPPYCAKLKSQKMTHPIMQACSPSKWPTLLRKPVLTENDPPYYEKLES